MEKYKAGDVLKVIVPNYPYDEEWLVINNCYTVDTTTSKSTYETLVREKLEAHVGVKLNSLSNPTITFEPTIIFDWYIESSFSSKDLNITFATQEEIHTLLTILEQNNLQYIDATNTLIGNLDNCKKIIVFNNTIDYYELPNINIGDFIVRNYSKTIYKVINITTRGIYVMYTDNKNNLLNSFIHIAQLTNFNRVDFDDIDSFSSLNQSFDNFVNTVNEYKKYLTI